MYSSRLCTRKYICLEHIFRQFFFIIIFINAKGLLYKEELRLRQWLQTIFCMKRYQCARRFSSTSNISVRYRETRVICHLAQKAQERTLECLWAAAGDQWHSFLLPPSDSSAYGTICSQVCLPKMSGEGTFRGIRGLI